MCALVLLLSSFCLYVHLCFCYQHSVYMCTCAFVISILFICALVLLLSAFCVNLRVSSDCKQYECHSLVLQWIVSLHADFWFCYHFSLIFVLYKIPTLCDWTTPLRRGCLYGKRNVSDSGVCCGRAWSYNHNNGRPIIVPPTYSILAVISRFEIFNRIFRFTVVYNVGSMCPAVTDVTTTVKRKKEFWRKRMTFRDSWRFSRANSVLLAVWMHNCLEV